MIGEASCEPSEDVSESFNGDRVSGIEDGVLDSELNGDEACVRLVDGNGGNSV
jgi:hypothetical protein